MNLLRLMLTTPAAGWLGSPNFGMREMLAELSFKSHLRAETVRRLNDNLCDLGIEGVEVKTIELDSKNSAESFCLLTLIYKDRGAEVQRVRL